MIKILKGNTFVIDTETNGLQPSNGARIFKIGIEDEEGNIIIADRTMGEWIFIKNIVEDEKYTKIFHNAKFDLRMMNHEGWKPKGICHDTMFMAHTLNEYEPSLSLEFLSKKYLPETFKDASHIKEGLKKLKRERRKEDIFIEPTYEDIDEKELDEYLETDLDCTMHLNWLFHDSVMNTFKEIYNYERRLIPCVARMEDIGVKIDIDYCKAVVKKLIPKLKEYEKQIQKLIGKTFNVRSHVQLKEALHEKGILVPNTQKETLEGFKKYHTAITYLLEFKKYDKYLSTFIIPMLQLSLGDILHCNFWQLGQDKGIKTARFSSSKPNLQNQPKRESLITRRAFIPREGYVFVFADYSQIEARLFAHYSQDKGMLETFRKGIDFHETNMRRFWKKEFNSFKGKTYTRKRDEAKIITFALQYGMGNASLAKALEWTLSEAKTFKRNYLIEFPTVAKLLKDCQNELFRNGYVEDVFGRRYRVPIKLSYKAINAKIQGTAAGVLKRGMVRLWESILQTEDLRLLLTVHDENIFEMRKKDMPRLIPEIIRLMEDHDNFLIPMTVDVEWSEKSWADKKGWKND